MICAYKRILGSHQKVNLKFCLLAAISMLMCACAGNPSRDYVYGSQEPARTTPRAATTSRQPNAARAETAIGSSIAELALELIGTPYRYGGSDPSGFDCSGLVFYTYANTGLSVPRTSAEQFREARKIALTQAHEGDLVFFQDQENLSHVGIYLGNGMFVHAPSSGRHVSIASLDAPYYQRHLVGVGRLLPN